MEANRKLESTKSSLILEVNKLKTELAEYVAHTDVLNVKVSHCFSRQVNIVITGINGI